MSYQSFEEIINVCTSENKEFWQVILEDDIAERNVTCEEILSKPAAQPSVGRFLRKEWRLWKESDPGRCPVLWNCCPRSRRRWSA